MVALLLETDDFAAAAWTMFRDAGDPLVAALFRLESSLTDCGGMAGSDPGGRSWASSYDALASSALPGLRSLANGCYRLSAMFGQTCRNYAAAERMSTADRWDVASAELDVAQLPGDTSVTWDVSVPSAAGVASGGPPGWSLVSGLVGRVWPDGHQDRLRAAAAAWRAAAASVDDVAARVRAVPAQFAGARLPEADAMAAVCSAVVDAAAQLQTSMAHAADSCDSLAGALDRAHAEIEHELVSLTEQSALIEGIGQLLSAATFGAGELPTQLVEGSRLAAVAARITALIDEFLGLVAGLAARLPTLSEVAARAGQSLEDLFRAPLAVAAAEPVRTLPAQLSTVSGITRTEMAAERYLSGESDASRMARLDLEAQERAGGHTIARHVGLSRAELKARNTKIASTFFDLEKAESATASNLLRHEVDIARWLEGTKPKLTISMSAGEPIGVSYLARSGEFVEARRVVTVLQRANNARGFTIFTSFPSP